MNPALRTFWMISVAVVFFVGTSGCGQKHLSVSTTSGKANQQEELEASLQDSPSAQTGIQDSTFTETGLGSELETQGQGSQGSTDQETAMVVEPPPTPTIRGERAEEPIDTSVTGRNSTTPEMGEGIPHHPQSGFEEDTSAPSAYQTALEPEFESSASDAGDGAPVAAFDSHETNQATPSLESPTEEEFGALVEPGPDQGEMMESTHVERIPENIVVAKVEPSNAVEEQLARIHEDEMATAAAGLQDIYFEFDSWKITQEGKDLLEKNANMLQNDTDMNLLIEGHCDQRGTQAYNIVLGKKRAIAIRDYLVALGVDSSRLSVITYGKEKPFCTDSTEFCYQENRRGHLIVQ